MPSSACRTAVSSFVAGRLLQEKAGGPSADGVGRQVRIVVHRQHDDFAVEALGLQAGEHVETREPWHREVGDDEVGAKPRGGVDQALAVANRADHLEAGLSQILDRPSVTIV